MCVCKNIDSLMTISRSMLCCLECADSIIKEMAASSAVTADYVLKPPPYSLV